MTTMSFLLAMSNQFLTERAWWQFHNPKNDAASIMVEAGELAEHFILHENVTDATRIDISDEISDVIFGCLIVALGHSIDITHEIGLLIGNDTLHDESTSYEQLRAIVLQHRNKFNLENLSSARQVALSLIVGASNILDLFIWCSAEDSWTIAKEKHTIIVQQLAQIMAHLIVLSTMANLNLPTEYARKMQLNALRYPATIKSIEEYTTAKEKKRRK